MVSRLRPAWLIVLVAFAVPVAFAAFADHAWEDYYITLRASRNLVEGHGLVFTPGERLHTFTSPLGVLLPALCTWIAGVGHEEAALWLFRLISSALIGATAWLVWRRAESIGVGLFGRVTFLALLLTDSKLIHFATNGMETAILVYFALLLWSELEAPAGPRLGRVALAVAGLMWTRPDAFILGLALGLPHLVFRRRVPDQPAIPWRALIGGALIGGLIYLPWFAWAWWYYGTPVPHTILAKSLVTPEVHWQDIVTTPWRTITGASLLRDLFLPAYWFYGGWPAGLSTIGYLLSLPASFLWLVPSLPLLARRASLSVFLGALYICAIILFPWYSPPWTVLAFVALAFTLDHLANRATAAGRAWVASAARIVATLVVGIQVGVIAATAWEMRVQERLIEYGVRRDIGHWLHATALPGDTVFLEPLGYIGYYSQLKMYDYPGLSSREVVGEIKRGHLRFAEVIAALHPTWLVLRPFEIADRTKPENSALNDYELVRTWNARPALDATRLLPGRPWLEHDAEFSVFRRKELPPPRTP
jgi:hypothetical protein